MIKDVFDLPAMQLKQYNSTTEENNMMPFAAAPRGHSQTA